MGKKLQPKAIPGDIQTSEISVEDPPAMPEVLRDALGFFGAALHSFLEVTSQADLKRSASAVMDEARVAGSARYDGLPEWHDRWNDPDDAGGMERALALRQVADLLGRMTVRRAGSRHRTPEPTDNPFRDMLTTAAARRGETVLVGIEGVVDFSGDLLGDGTIQRYKSDGTAYLHLLVNPRGDLDVRCQKEDWNVRLPLSRPSRAG